MDVLRIALTVLPVGPRGTPVLDANADLWFALQISAGFKDAHDAAAIDKLWPWVLHVIDSGKVKLRCFVLDNSGATTSRNDHDAAVPSTDAFTTKLRDKITKIYSDADLRRTLDLRLLLPGEVAANQKEAHERASFPARVQYLATLPGELSRRLLATLYVKIPRNELFAKSTGTWQATGKTLWIAPVSVNGSTKIDFSGDPAKDGDVFKQVKNDGSADIVAVGPGFLLSNFITPRRDVFKLDTYEVTVADGDRRYVELESLLLNVLDPFAELHAVEASDARDGITLKNGGASRAIAEEEFAALVDAWRVRAFADALAALFPAGLQELLALLVPRNETAPALTIPDRWGASFATELGEKPLVLAAKLAPRIGVARMEERATLKRVSERAGFAEAARLLARAFDESLNATTGVTKPLRDAWRFGDRFSAEQLLERQVTLAHAAIAHVRERKEVTQLLPGLKSAAMTSKPETLLRDAAINQVIGRWTKRDAPEFVETLVALRLGAQGEQLTFDPNLGKTIATGFVDMVWPAKTEPGAELPGRGLTLQVGDPLQRFVHEDNNAADMPFESPYREVAGVLLLARRGTSDTDVLTRPWRIVTAGAALAGETDKLFIPSEITTGDLLEELLPLPIRPVFQQKVMRADVEYHGQPMLARSALDHAYAGEDYVVEDAGGLDAAYSFHSIGSFGGGLTDAAKASRAPALRYGDVYEFRGGVMDQAGGMPTTFASATEPWRLDVAKLAAQNPTASRPTYLRTIPPGDVNILPGIDPKEKKPAWPPLPDDVSLRVREFRALDHRDADSLPALLLRGPSFGNAFRDYRFRVVPPVIDEHTLIRWAIPPLDDANAAAKVADLKSALAELFDQRASQTAVQLHDPAVASLGVVIRAAGSDNKVAEIFRKAIEPKPVTGKPFQRMPVNVHVASAPFSAAPQASGDANGIEITLPEGSFAVIEVFPLVSGSDYSSRFTKFEEMIDASAGFAGQVAFHPSVLLVESATTALPDPNALFDNLRLEERDNQIAIHFDDKSAVANLVFVDRFSIERDRWVWRNLPLVTTRSLEDTSLTPQERIRLLASGPPSDVFKPQSRDTSGAVMEWERIASIDRGFADRGEIAGRWPRLPGVAPFAGGPGVNVLLASDNRDGVTAADYLRFGLRVRSRYAGVLPERSREVPDRKQRAQRRRIVTEFRGAKIKPPKILGIVPLTASLESDPLKTPPGVTPFLVLLDESFFREYGVGERIEMQLTLENLDIGEKPDEPLPYRTGPLPDHWLHSKASGDQRYFRGKRFKIDDDQSSPIVLNLFGPFGYSLDLTPSEALANATAFVAYPPADVKAHWAMFVRLRRVLDKPSKGRASDFSDVHALYTLPDTRMLRSGDDGFIELSLTGKTATLKDLRLVLDPTAQAAAPGKDPQQNSEASSQYRYFLLVSRVVAGAGQGFDAEIPSGLWRMPLFDPATAGLQPPNSYMIEFRSGRQLAVSPLTQDSGTPVAVDKAVYRGRILEVMINGQYEKKARIDDINGWTAFWESLLDTAAADEIDAAGMVRRVSQAFPVSVV